MRKAKVYWITGLSGAGKTTIGKILVNRLRAKNYTVAHLDGDFVREVLNSKAGHTKDERKALALTYSRMCKMLSDQGITVVCTTISMFDTVRQWNRDFIANYAEIYLRVPIEILIQRDQKKLYSNALNGKIQNVLGINEVYDAPKNCDIVIENNGTLTPEEIVEVIFERDVGV